MKKRLQPTRHTWQGLTINSVDEYGSVESISATEKGTYKVIYQAIDGSGKKFTLKIKVK